MIEHKAHQDKQIAEVGDDNGDYKFRFVLGQLNGRPYEAKDFSKKFKRFVNENSLRKVDFYSLRHSGATIKLNHGASIKSVQADMGHASADMLLNVYATSNDEERIKNANIMEDYVYCTTDNDEYESSQGATSTT